MSEESKNFNRVGRINKIWNEVNAHISGVSIDSDPSKIQYQLSCLFFPGPSFSWIFDVTTRKHEYVSESVVDILGVSPKAFTVDLILSLIHPNDVENTLKNLGLISKFFGIYLKPEERPFYKSSQHLRIKTKSGKYRKFLDQQIVISQNDDGQLSKILVNFSDISNLVENSEESKLSFIDLRGLRSYYYLTSEKDFKRIFEPETILSKRELEVVKLVSEGYDNNEIGNLLFVSAQTVRKHRTNILQKTKYNKFAQVVAYAIKDGLI